VAEIERKFLVREMPRAESGQTVIEQGYLALDENAEVRLRRAGAELLLTAKVGHGEVREEVEVPVEPRAFEALWPLTEGRRVRKVRHYVPLRGDLRAEVDVYGGELEGLRTAEVEFDSRAEADRFSPPPWLGEELTGDLRYANQTLATEGMPPELLKDGELGTEDAMDIDPPVDDGAAETLGDPTEAPKPSRTYRLGDDESAAEGMRRVILGRLDKASERLREPSDGDALAEAIHGARKDLKKARAALRLIRDELGEKAFKRENHALRDAARLLSASRDAGVKLETLDALVAGHEGDAPPAAAALWREALVADRDRIVDADADQTDAAVEAIEAVAARIPEWKIGHDGWKLLAPGLDTAYRDGRADFLALGDSAGFDAVHDLRKRGKDLWYQLRLLEDAWPAVLKPTAEEIHDFTDLLGDHHDLAVLAEDLAERDELDAAHRTTLRALIAARQSTLLAEAIGTGHRIYADKPKAFGRRLRAYWRASRPTSA
jgi:CYTH domain-containing protein/CHAD domain-containing protein